MQSHALKQSETQKAAVTAPVKAEAADMQMVSAEEEPVQMKVNPLQMPGYTDNPLQMRRPSNNPFQRKEGGEPPYQGPGYKINPLVPIKYDNPFQRKPNNQNPLAQKTSTYNPLQPKLYNSQPLQRMAADEEEESAVQMKKENNTGLPDALKDGVEALSGYAMDDVKVHYNSDKPAQLQALAYAQGTDIHVAPGQEKHLPHEAWHVVQQKQGRVQATMQMKEGIAVNDDKGLEREADVMGEKAIDFRQEKVPIKSNKGRSSVRLAGNSNITANAIQKQLDEKSLTELQEINDVDTLIDWLITSINGKDIPEAILNWLRLHQDQKDKENEIRLRVSEMNKDNVEIDGKAINWVYKKISIQDILWHSTDGSKKEVKENFKLANKITYFSLTVPHHMNNVDVRFAVKREINVVDLTVLENFNSLQAYLKKTEDADSDGALTRKVRFDKDKKTEKMIASFRTASGDDKILHNFFSSVNLPGWYGKLQGYEEVMLIEPLYYLDPHGFTVL